MKREIKFKAKRVGNGEWIKGTPLVGADTENVFYDQEGGYITNMFDGYGNLIGEIVEDSICQFTGLKDKNDVEIYEGDKFDIGKGCYAVVVFDQETASFKLNVYKLDDESNSKLVFKIKTCTPNGETIENTAQLSYMANYYSITGNIHD